jgi:hypothetical protein
MKRVDIWTVAFSLRVGPLPFKRKTAAPFFLERRVDRGTNVTPIFQSHPSKHATNPKVPQSVRLLLPVRHRFLPATNF